MKIYTYRIYFPEPDKCYIGQTNNIEKRMKEHLRSGSLVCKALWKYDDWDVSILHICKSRDVAHTLEIEEIRNHKSVAPNGYNLTYGGEGVTASDETKEKLSKASLGKPKSEEAKRNMSKAKLGNQYTLGHQNSLGYKHTKAHIESLRGNQNAKGNTFKQSAEAILKQKLARYKNIAAKLEVELEQDLLI